MGNQKRRFETPKQAGAHVKMAADNLIRAGTQIGKVTQRMVVLEAQRHGVSQQDVAQQLRKRGIAISLE